VQVKLIRKNSPIEGYGVFAGEFIPKGTRVIEYSGLRPGEKLYEELLTEGEGIKETRHEKIKVLECPGIDSGYIYRTLDRLEAACKKGAFEEVKSILKILVPEYHMQDAASDENLVIKEVADSFSLNSVSTVH